MKNFIVSVIGCNIELFASNYSEYIIVWHDDAFGNRVFNLCAPQSVYNEIENLKEECIEII